MSCLVPVETIDGAAVRTLEGVAGADGELDAVQAAFLEGFATQCGFCTSGMIMAAEALLAANPDPTREDVVRAISGNVCRCTGYESIINAVLDAARARRRRWCADGPADRAARPDLLRRRARRRLRRHRHAGPALRRARARHRADRVLRGRPADRDAAPQDAPLRAPPRAADATSTSSPALEVPGVVRVLTHEDVPNNWYTILRLIGVEPNDEPVLPEDRVLYLGEPIVAVVATSEAAALAGAAAVRVDLRGPAGRVRRRGGAGRGRARRSSRTARTTSSTRATTAAGSASATSTRRSRAADHVFEWRYQSSPIEHAPTETTGLHRGPAARRPAADPLRHAGVLLHARQRRADPRRPVRQAARRRRHGRRRLRRQGRRDGRADRLHRGDEDEQAGQVRVRPRGGDAGVLAARGRADLHQGRRDGRRHDRRPQGHAVRRRRRVLPPQPVRHDEGVGAHARARTPSPTCGSTRTACTRTGRRRARCAGSA